MANSWRCSKCALEFAILFVPRGNVHASLAVLIWEWVGFFLEEKGWADFSDWCKFQIGFARDFTYYPIHD